MELLKGFLGIEGYKFTHKWNYSKGSWELRVLLVACRGGDLLAAVVLNPKPRSCILDPKPKS